MDPVDKVQKKAAKKNHQSQILIIFAFPKKNSLMLYDHVHPIFFFFSDTKTSIVCCMLKKKNCSPKWLKSFLPKLLWNEWKNELTGTCLNIRQTYRGRLAPNRIRFRKSLSKRYVCRNRYRIADRTLNSMEIWHQIVQQENSMCTSASCAVSTAIFFPLEAFKTTKLLHVVSVPLVKTSSKWNNLKFELWEKKVTRGAKKKVFLGGTREISRKTQFYFLMPFFFRKCESLGRNVYFFSLKRN